MLQLRRSDERGHFDFGWLDTRHTFSFSDYYDPAHMAFRALRVINEDRVRPGEGFPTHPHQSMEIFTYVLEGKLEHKDSMGTGSVIEPGDIQRMSAGAGVTHSEYNASKTDAVHLLQIWVLPKEKGGKPSYEQKRFSSDEKRDRMRLVLSPDGRDGSVTIHQDVAVYATMPSEGKEVTLELPPGRHAWVQVARGAVTLNGVELVAGDGAALSEEKRIAITGRAVSSEVIVFDLA